MLKSMDTTLRVGSVLKKWLNLRGKYNLIDSDFESSEYNNLVEEIADVQIMLSQMENFINCEDSVLNVIEDKLNRQIQRIVDKNKEI